MINKRINHWVGFSLLLLIMSFFFYKSIISKVPFEESMHTIEKLHGLQIQLHRDVLRHRNNQLHQYDSLNSSLKNVYETIKSLTVTEYEEQYPDISKAIHHLHRSVLNQDIIVEDFKTHFSILQNSLTYFSRVSSEIYGNKSKNNLIISRAILGELSTLLLQYTRKSDHEDELKLYSIIDKLNRKPTSEVKALINHSLTVIEKLSEVDKVIRDFNALGIERQINNIKSDIGTLQKEHERNAFTFNTLLFVFSLYLIVYVGFMLVTLQRNKNTMALANKQLSKEIVERKRTERALYQLVDNDSDEHVEDYLYNLLKSLCNSLNVRCAYISYLSDNDGEAFMAGIINNGSYRTNIHYQLEGTPCEEVLRDGRLVHNRDISRYFPFWKLDELKNKDSYIGIRLKDNNNNIKGLLAIVHDEPIKNSNLAESILTLSASRAITEVSRQIALRNSIRYQNGLELIDSWMAKLVFGGVSIEQFLNDACTAAREISDGKISAFPVIDQGGSSYSINAVDGNNSDKMKCNNVSINEKGLCGWAMLHKETICINDIKSDSRAKKDVAEIMNVKNALVTPVLVDGEAYGAIAILRNNPEFDEIDTQLITQFSQSVQMAIINMKLLSDIESQKERAEVTLHSIADAVITTNSSGNIEYMNHIAENLTGWTLNEKKNQPIQDVFRIIDHDTREPIHNLVNACLADGTSISKSMTTLIAKDCTEREIENSMSPILSSSGKPGGVVVVFHDETERRQMENFIKHQATHDSLTGLNNRNEFDQRLTEHIHDSKHNGSEHALCYLDLDRFKLVNDTSGHAAGDELLRQVTTILNSIIRGGDIIGRLGGDEFGLILQNCPLENAKNITEKIIRDISNLQFHWSTHTFTIGVSIGLVAITSDSPSSPELMKQVDVACYTAKDHGRNCVYVYQHKDNELIKRQEEMHWAGKISQALDKNQLRLYAQAICPLNNRRKNELHLEILLRLEDDDGNLIQPGSFIPAAERYNLMASIDKRVIKDTFKYISKTGKSDNRNICYCINLSGNSLNESDFANYIKHNISEFNINAKNICFEITETAAITNLFRAKKLMVSLKEIGCRFALDDFGSGLSSFGYLKNLPVDYLKIDGSFVRDMVNNKTDHAMVAAINQIGHVMGIQTIAEFVENKNIILALQQLKVDYAQGYGIARPLPLEEFSAGEIPSTAKIIKLSDRV